MPELSEVDFSKASAPDILKAALDPYGLGGLAGDVYGQWKNNGNDSNLAYLWMRQQPLYKQTFPGMDVREKNGYAPITERQYNDYTTSVKSVMANNGIPQGFYDSPDDFAQMIGMNISAPEIEGRVIKGVVAAQNAPQYVKDALFNFYGIDDGHLAAYFLDPNKSMDLLQRQAATAAIGGASTFSGYGALTKSEAEHLQAQGVTEQTALQGFGQLDHSKELLTGLPGEASQGISREQQLAAVAGSPEAQQALQQAATRRKAAFGGGGQYAESQQGVTGLAPQS